MIKTRFAVFFIFLSFLTMNAFAFEDKNSLQLAFGPSMHVLDLKSDLFSANQPYVQGLGLQAGYVHFSNDGFLRAEINYSDLTNNYLTSSALSPTSISVRHQTAEIFILGLVKAYGHRFLRLGLGYTFLKQSADQTTPNVLVVDSEMQALELKTTYDIYKENDLVVNAGLGLGLPFRHAEYGVQSGVNLKSTILNLNANFQYYLNLKWSILAKLQYSLVQTLADGTGSRGTLNSAERKQTIFLPIGFSYEF